MVRDYAYPDGVGTDRFGGEELRKDAARIQNEGKALAAIVVVRNTGSCQAVKTDAASEEIAMIAGPRAFRQVNVGIEHRGVKTSADVFQSKVNRDGRRLCGEKLLSVFGVPEEGVRTRACDFELSRTTSQQFRFLG